MFILSTNLLNYCNLEYSYSSNNIIPITEVKNNIITLEFEEILNLYKKRMDIKLSAIKKLIPKVQTNSIKDIIASFAPIQFIYKDLQSQ